MLIDSHCHLQMIDLVALNTDLGSVVETASNHGIEHMLCVSTILTELPEIFRIAEQYSAVSASVGLHPNEETETEPTVQDLLSLATHPKVIAIGETGLDYYRTEGAQQWQQERFERHMEASKISNKPLIIHTRQARKDTVSMLKEAGDVRGVIHCFTEDWDTAKAALDLGFYISFSGILTFKNAQDLQAVAKKVPIDRLLIETDAPFLAPVPHRGKINQPHYVKHVAEFLAQLRADSFENIASQTTNNFYRLFPVST